MKLYFLLLLLTIVKGNVVLDFEGDNDSIAELKVDLQIPINESTFCINFHYQRYGNIGMFSRPGKPATLGKPSLYGLYLAIVLLRDSVVWQFDRDPRYTFDLNGLLSPYEWIRFCVANDDNSTVLVSKGQVIGSATRRNDKYPDQLFIPIPSFHFGIKKLVPQTDIKVTVEYLDNEDDSKN